MRAFAGNADISAPDTPDEPIVPDEPDNPPVTPDDPDEPDIPPMVNPDPPAMPSAPADPDRSDNSGASDDLNTRKGSTDKELAAASDNGFTTVKEPWLSQNTGVHTDQLSYLHDDTFIDLGLTRDMVRASNRAQTERFGTHTVLRTRMQQALAGSGDEPLSVLEELAADTEDTEQEELETAVRLLLSEYFTRKADEQVAVAGKDLKKASPAGGAGMDNVMGALVGARMYAIAAQAAAGTDTGSKQKLAELPPTVESLYWSGSVQRGFGKEAMQTIRMHAGQSTTDRTTSAQIDTARINTVRPNAAPAMPDAAAAPGAAAAPQIQAAQRIVVNNLNGHLNSIFAALAKSNAVLQADESGDFTARATSSVLDALKNDEMLQRYIDLYNYYVNEKMSFAGVLMG